MYASFSPARPRASHASRCDARDAGYGTRSPALKCRVHARTPP